MLWHCIPMTPSNRAEITWNHRTFLSPFLVQLLFHKNVDGFGMSQRAISCVTTGGWDKLPSGYVNIIQYTYGTWPSMMDFSVEHGGSSILMWVSQRIKHHEIPWNQHVPIVFPWFFAEIHIIFKENFTWPGALQSGRWVFDLWHRASCSAASCAAVAGGAQWRVGVSKVKRWLNNHQNDLKCLSQWKWCYNMLHMNGNIHWNLNGF